jgi:hypothetical protein
VLLENGAVDFEQVVQPLRRALHLLLRAAAFRNVDKNTQGAHLPVCSIAGRFNRECLTPSSHPAQLPLVIEHAIFKIEVGCVL